MILVNLRESIHPRYTKPCQNAHRYVGHNKRWLTAKQSSEIAGKAFIHQVDKHRNLLDQPLEVPHLSVYSKVRSTEICPYTPSWVLKKSRESHMRNDPDQNSEPSDLSMHTELVIEKTMEIISLRRFIIMFRSTEICPCSPSWLSIPTMHTKTPSRTMEAAVEILTSRSTDLNPSPAMGRLRSMIRIISVCLDRFIVAKIVTINDGRGSKQGERPSTPRQNSPPQTGCSHECVEVSTIEISAIGEINFPRRPKHLMTSNEDYQASRRKTEHFSSLALLGTES
ncbi:hypothetical protein KQX54_010187 [Cotesia glomerata]|uniref:Uncharacterized protein n=1 Tax=Cotesia glomerata TaxID=32391 RepID=A0AAV7ICU4_COTGL|nr:hypothetical protein KQX54_010187 [Cotesia glomerata]